MLAELTPRLPNPSNNDELYEQQGPGHGINHEIQAHAIKKPQARTQARVFKRALLKFIEVQGLERSLKTCAINQLKAGLELSHSHLVGESDLFSMASVCLQDKMFLKFGWL